jgi:hypothetical protein
MNSASAEQRIRRSVERNMAELKALQAGRKALEQAEEESRLLVQLAEYEGRDFDPGNDLPPESQPLGFVFSRPAIQRQIERGHRLHRARHLGFHGYFRPDIPNPMSPSPTTNPPPSKKAMSPAQRSPQSTSALASEIERSKLLQSRLGVSFR